MRNSVSLCSPLKRSPSMLFAKFTGGTFRGVRNMRGVTARGVCMGARAACYLPPPPLLLVFLSNLPQLQRFCAELSDTPPPCHSRPLHSLLPSLNEKKERIVGSGVKEGGKCQSRNDEIGKNKRNSRIGGGGSYIRISSRKKRKKEKRKKEKNGDRKIEIEKEWGERGCSALA